MGDFDWTVHPEAEGLVSGLLDEALMRSPRLAALAERLLRDTSTRLVDWLDHVGGPIAEERLRAAGFADGYRAPPGLWRHPGAQLPAVAPGEQYAVALATRGAVGSHLENLARRGGFKGFNQSNVSVTMRATDPRR